MTEETSIQIENDIVDVFSRWLPFVELKDIQIIILKIIKIIIINKVQIETFNKIIVVIIFNLLNRVWI